MYTLRAILYYLLAGWNDKHYVVDLCIYVIHIISLRNLMLY